MDPPAAPSEAVGPTPVEAHQLGRSGPRVILEANVPAFKLTQVGEVDVFKSGFGSGMRRR